MGTTATMAGSRLWSRIRWVVWGGACLLLMLPLVAMQFTREVNWTLSDFVVMGFMLGMVCVAFEIAVRVARSNAYVVAAGIAVAAAFLMTWANLAVGIIGNENNPANLMFFGVIGLGLVGALLARLKPQGMARAMYVTAAAQIAVSVITLAIGEGYIFVFTGVFVAIWLIAAQLFQKAAQQEAAVAG